MKSSVVHRFELSLVNTQRAFAWALAGFALIVCTIIVCVLTGFGDERQNVLYLLMTFVNLVIARYGHTHTVLVEVHQEALRIVDQKEYESNAMEFRYADIAEYGFVRFRNNIDQLVLIMNGGEKTTVHFRHNYRNGDILKNFKDELPRAIEKYDKLHTRAEKP